MCRINVELTSSMLLSGCNHWLSNPFENRRTGQLWFPASKKQPVTNDAQLIVLAAQRWVPLEHRCDVSSLLRHLKILVQDFNNWTFTIICKAYILWNGTLVCENYSKSFLMIHTNFSTCHGWFLTNSSFEPRVETSHVIYPAIYSNLITRLLRTTAGNTSH